jgi:hypothetical protein
MPESVNQIAHRQYLNSPIWNEIRTKAINHYGKICANCGEYGTDVHHLSYPEIQGEERVEDLMVLCRSCHEAIHSVRRGCFNSGGLHARGLFNYLTDKHKEILSANLKYSLYYTFMSDTPDGEKIREMALKMLDVQSYHGLEKVVKDEIYLTAEESRKKAEIDKKKSEKRAEKLRKELSKKY